MGDARWWALGACALALLACDEFDGDGTLSDGGMALVPDDDGDDDRAGRPGDLSGDGDDGDRGPDPGRCRLAGDAIEIATGAVDKIDLLFMVDNSGSMREEQDSLRVQFPRLLRVLTTGDRDLDGVMDFPPARDVHLGVVSSDMGLVGIQGIPGCENLGDDGIMNNIPNPALEACQASYPRFITYSAGINDPNQTADDFACIATLGTEGCGFEQQLESALKALWPSVDIDPETGDVIEPNRILFKGDVNGFGQLGHGDQENAGFLRNDVVQGRSLVSIVIVSDEEDCSSADTTHFTPDIYLDPSDPLAMQDLNLRCFYNAQNLYSVDRYVNGFKALRPDNEELVLFSAIVGVPVDLVSPQARAAVDFEDDGEREAFYDGILTDERMREAPDPTRTPEQGGNLTPSCITERGRAFPPRRIVETVKRFGRQGTLGSICQEDFTPAIDPIIDAMSARLGAPCLPRPLARDDGGLSGCAVVWELPPPNLAPPNTPTTCLQSGWEFLRPPSGGDLFDARGGSVCEVAQLPVVAGEVASGEGWYYDDFSDDTETECTGGSKQRVAFTPRAKPPTGVTVKLVCGDAETPPDTLVVCDGAQAP